MNNKRIKAFLLIACIINLIITNCIPVYATVPGVVEAENVWLTLETLAFTMGVNLPFIPDKSISYNNNKRKQEMIDYIDWEYSQGVLTQQQHDDAIQQLDNIIYYGGEHGVGSAISIGTELWSSLSHYFYDGYIKTDVNFYPSLNPDAKIAFDSYSGTCAIYGILNNDGNGNIDNAGYVVILGNAALQSPIRGGYSSLFQCYQWTIARGNGSEFYYEMFNNYYGGLKRSAYTDSSSFYYFIGDSVSVQYFENKEADQAIISNDGENSLVSYPTYNDYTNGLNNVYSISNGQVVVTDTGDAPAVLDGDSIADTVAGINDGVVSWENAIPQIYANEDIGAIEGENPVIGKKALDELVTGLNVTQIKNKFPFCIPNDIKEIASGAASVSGNAPVITIPLKLEFAGTTYYEDNEAVVIDFKDFSQLALIFRKGFLLLFLVGMIYLSIYVISSFFHVTE